MSSSDAGLLDVGSFFYFFLLLSSFVFSACVCACERERRVTCDVILKLTDYIPNK